MRNKPIEVEDEKSVQEINEGIFQLIQFYGSVVATPNISLEITDKCNSKILDLVKSMDSDTDKIISMKLAKNMDLKLVR